MIDGLREKVNFFIYYEIHDEEAKTVLRMDDYDEDEGAWVLLSPSRRQRRGHESDM